MLLPCRAYFLWLFVFICKKKKENVTCICVVNQISRRLLVFLRALNYCQKRVHPIRNPGASFMNEICDALNLESNNPKNSNNHWIHFTAFLPDFDHFWCSFLMSWFGFWSLAPHLDTLNFHKWGSRWGRAKEMTTMHLTWYKAILLFLFFNFFQQQGTLAVQCQYTMSVEPFT